MKPLTPAFKTLNGENVLLNGKPQPLFCKRCGKQTGTDEGSYYPYLFCLDEKKCKWNSTYES